MKEYLLIPFDKKDEIKKDYPIKWDVAKKLWYFDTVTSDAAQDRTCTARAVVRSGHRTTARAVKKN